MVFDDLLKKLFLRHCVCDYFVELIVDNNAGLMKSKHSENFDWFKKHRKNVLN